MNDIYKFIEYLRDNHGCEFNLNSLINTFKNMDNYKDIVCKIHEEPRNKPFDKIIIKDRNTVYYIYIDVRENNNVMIRKIFRDTYSIYDYDDENKIEDEG